MAAQDFLPKTDALRLAWLAKFKDKFGTYATGLGLATELPNVTRDYDTFLYLLNTVDQFKSEAQERVKYKKLMADGKLGAPQPTPPNPTTLTPPANIAPPAIFPRLRLLVQRIKLSPAYNTAIGTDLGIIGKSETPGVAKPSLTATTTPGVLTVTLKFVKATYSGVQLEVERGNTPGFVVAANAIVSPFAHSLPPATPGMPETRRYRARFLKGNAPVGEYSDVVTVVVG